MKHGSGVMKYPDESKHIGHWEMDKLHGIVYYITRD
jgi:hypothetical protein